MATKEEMKIYGEHLEDCHCRVCRKVHEENTSSASAFPEWERQMRFGN